MLDFYKDALLTQPVTLSSPKRFLIPEKGGDRATSLYLGDPYTAKITSSASSGSTTLLLDQTYEFDSTGKANINGMLISYTGKTGTALTGVSGLTSGVVAGDTIVPDVRYVITNSFLITVRGNDLATCPVRLKRSDQTSYGFYNAGVLYPATYISMGSANAVQVDLQITVAAGVAQEFSNIEVVTPTLYRRQVSDVSAYNVSTDVLFAPLGQITVQRQDQGLQLQSRVLPESRKVDPSTPGFVLGDYRWRDDRTSNQYPIIPASWNVTPAQVGYDKFTSGIGYGDDLLPVSVEDLDHAIVLNIQAGSYFYGPEEFYLPANPVVEFLQAIPSTTTHTLTQTPSPIVPVFVGYWKLDSRGVYSKGFEYQHVGTQFQGLNVDYQAIDVTFNDMQVQVQDLQADYSQSYRLDRKSRTLELGAGLADHILRIGTTATPGIQTFYLPIYPVHAIQEAWVQNGSVRIAIPFGASDFDQDSGTIRLNIPQTLVSQNVFVRATPAVAVVYDTEPMGTIRKVSEVDLNPATTGISSGYMYIEHRHPQPAVIGLDADKPIIDIPATQELTTGLIAYGPVYAQGDYAMLIARVWGSLGEQVSSLRLKVVPDTGFVGLVNYLDPTANDVWVTTGADGAANLVYTCDSSLGSYLATSAIGTTTITGDTLTLPAPVPISQIYSSLDGWLVTTYTVDNTNPLLGKVGANTSQGEIPWTTSGTAGTTSYKTNGMREVWRYQQAIVRPIDALDSLGRSYTNGSFSGSVSKLVYGIAIPAASNYGAYFVTYLTRVGLKLVTEDGLLSSNRILLQLDLPPVYNDNPWLYVDGLNVSAGVDTNGALNTFRLGWTPILRTTPSTQRF